MSTKPGAGQRSGEISASRDANGALQVEAAELQHIFAPGVPTEGSSVASDQVSQSDDSAPPDVELAIRVSLAEKCLSNLKEVLADMNVREQTQQPASAAPTSTRSWDLRWLAEK